MINTILWDIDGTLLNFVASEKFALKKTFKMFGINLSDDDISLYSQINDSYWTRFDKGEIDKEYIYSHRFNEFMEKLSIPDEKRPNWHDINEIYQVALGEVCCFNDNSYEIVKNLRGKCRQYIVTNGSLAAQEGKLKRSGFGELMDGVFISEQMGLQKPNIEFFNACFEKIPDFNKKTAIIIGDSLTSDIKGGINAGIKTCWYNPERKSAPDGLRIDYEIRDLHEVYGIVGVEITDK